MNKPLISIIVPVYNVVPYLRECLDSVQTQTFGDWECLCVDDGSTDGSGEVLDEYAQKDSRFRVFHKANGGVSSARNIALNNVKGEYITFLDGDDVIDLKWFENFVEVLKLYGKVEMINFAVQYTDEKMLQIILPKMSFIPKTYVKSNEQCVLNFWGSSLPHCVGMCTRFVAKEVFADILFDVNLKIGEDTVVVWDLISRINSYIEFDYQGYFYRNRKTSAIHTRRAFSSAVLKGQIARINRVFTYYNLFKNRDLVIKTFPIVRYANFYWRLLLFRLKILKSLTPPPHTQYVASTPAHNYWDKNVIVIKVFTSMIFLRMLLLSLNVVLFLINIKMK